MLDHQMGMRPHIPVRSDRFAHGVIARRKELLRVIIVREEKRLGYANGRHEKPP